jgi:hypothetical protein
MNGLILEDLNLLGYDAMFWGEWLLTLQRNIVPIYSSSPQRITAVYLGLLDA